MRRRRNCGIPRVEYWIGSANHPNFAVAARQLCGPFDGVVSVLFLHRVHVEDPAGPTAATLVLLHIDEAARGPELTVGFINAQVRCAFEDDAERPGPNRTRHI